MSDIDKVYAELRGLLARHAASLEVKRDDADELYVDTRHLQKNRKPLFFGAVQRKKAHVAYHLMPLYLQPELMALASEGLKARLQGKSCFHFKALEPGLLDELARLTQAGFDSYAAQGFV